MILFLTAQWCRNAQQTENENKHERLWHILQQNIGIYDEAKIE